MPHSRSASSIMRRLSCSIASASVPGRDGGRASARMRSERCSGPIGSAVLGQGHRPLDLVLELADVAGERVRLEQRHAPPARSTGPPRPARGDRPAGGSARRGPGCPRPLAQRRQRDREDVEPVVEVAPEAPRLDVRLEVGVGRGDDPHVDLAHVPARRRGAPRPPAARAAGGAASRRLISPTSSRKIVPPSASSKSPRRSRRWRR